MRVARNDLKQQQQHEGQRQTSNDDKHPIFFGMRFGHRITECDSTAGCDSTMADGDSTLTRDHDSTAMKHDSTAFGDSTATRDQQHGGMWYGQWTGCDSTVANGDSTLTKGHDSTAMKHDSTAFGESTAADKRSTARRHVVWMGWTADDVVCYFILLEYSCFIFDFTTLLRV